MEENPPEAEAQPQKAGPTPSSTVMPPKVPAFYPLPFSMGDSEVQYREPGLRGLESLGPYAVSATDCTCDLGHCKKYSIAMKVNKITDIKCLQFLGTPWAINEKQLFFHF